MSHPFTFTFHLHSAYGGLSQSFIHQGLGSHIPVIEEGMTRAAEVASQSFIHQGLGSHASGFSENIRSRAGRIPSSRNPLFIKPGQQGWSEGGKLKVSKKLTLYSTIILLNITRIS